MSRIQNTHAKARETKRIRIAQHSTDVYRLQQQYATSDPGYDVLVPTSL